MQDLDFGAGTPSRCKAKGILTMLQAPGLPMSESVRARVLSSKDLGMLDLWLLGATAAADTEVIAA